MPPVLEILSESIKWDPYGHLWGRGAHWPLFLSIGEERHRSKGMQMRRIDVANARWERNSAGRGCAGGDKGGGYGSNQWQRNPWARGGGWWRQGKGWQGPNTGRTMCSRDHWTVSGWSGRGCAGGGAASGSTDPCTAGAWTNASFPE